MLPADVERLNAVITDWARQRPDITGLAMIGSWASGRARPDSDLDLVLLTDRQSEFRRDRDWPDAIAWDRAGFAVEGWEDASYGALWSRHIMLVPRAALELSFAGPSWASLDPIEPGTLRIVEEGCRILIDKSGALADLVASVAK